MPRDDNGCLGTSMDDEGCFYLKVLLGTITNA